MNTVLHKSSANILYRISFIFYIIGAFYYGSVICRALKLTLFRFTVFLKAEEYHQYLLPIFIKSAIGIVWLILMVVAVVLFIIGLKKRIPRYIVAVILFFILSLMPLLEIVTYFDEYMVWCYPFDILGINFENTYETNYYILIKYILWGLPLVLLIISFILDRRNKKQ